MKKYKESEWFRGLKYAEQALYELDNERRNDSLNLLEIEYDVETYGQVNDEDEFYLGARAFIEHKREIRKQASMEWLKEFQKTLPFEPKNV